MLNYRLAILKSLKKLAEKEKLPFVDLYKSYDELIDHVVALKAQCERSRRECLDDGTSSSNIVLREKDKRILQLQEELTDLHRGKGENAQQIIELSKTLQAKDTENSLLKSKLAESVSQLSSLKASNLALDERNAELDKTNQLLRDEYLALQTAYNACEGRLRTCEQENQRLLQEVTRLNQRMADHLNAENERVPREKRERLTSEIAEAVKDDVPMVICKDERFDFVDKVPPVYVGSSIPTRCKLKLEAHEKEVTAVQWSTSGKYFASGGDDRRIKIWELREGQAKQVCSLIGCNMAVTSVQFDQQEQCVLGSSNDCTARIWTVATQRACHVLTGHVDKVMAAKYANFGQLVITGSYDRTLKVWDLTKKCCIKTLFAGRSCNDVVTSEGTGANIISGHSDQRVKFWDLRHSDEPVNDILLPGDTSLKKGKVTSLNLTSDSSYLLCSVREDADVIFYMDLRTNKIVHPFARPESFRLASDSARATLSPDAAYCAAGSADGLLYVWNVLSGRVEKVLKKEHTSAVLSCNWSPCGQSILSCDKQKLVCLWCDY